MNYKNITRYIKKYYFKIILAVFFVLISSLPQLLLITLAKELPVVFTNKSILPFLNLAISVIIIYILKGIFTYYYNYITGFVSTNIANDIRKELYKILINKEILELEDKNYGENTKLIVDDVNKINETVFSFISEFIPSFIMMFFTLNYIFYTSWKLAFTVLFLIPTIGFLINYFTIIIKDKSELIQKKIADTYLKIGESINNILIIKLFSIEDKKTNEFYNIQTENNKENINLIRIMASQPSIIGTVQTIMICLIVTYARFEMVNNNIDLSELLAFATAMTLTIEPVIFLTKSVGIISKNYPCINNIETYLEKSLKANDLNECKSLLFNDKNFTIRAENLNFYYTKGQNIFKRDLNFIIPQGNSFFISAENGSGKTTLVKIILGIYKNFLGDLKIGAYNISDYNNKLYLSNIKVVFNEPFLFNDSIKNNIFLDKDYDEKLFLDVCKFTLIDDFIQKYNNKYDFIIGYNGNNLSSGQKQRIAIARALISKPKILILDEATSAIDIESEKIIYNNIRNFLPNSTIIYINHRVKKEQFEGNILFL
ncbi:MAG: ABC transporter ATP-binding protein [Candidatus Sericytochromatia bacterium]